MAVKKTKVEVKKSVAGVNIDMAVKNLEAALVAANAVKDCPEKVTARIESLTAAVKRSGENIEKRLAGLGAKAERTAKAAQRKADRLTKLQKKAEALKAQIAELSK